MAKYELNYACGHGSQSLDLYGSSEERERRIAWASESKVCKNCYRDRKRAEDEVAPRSASIQYKVGFEGALVIVVTGQLEANREALHALGYRWMDDAGDGFLGWMSMAKKGRILAVEHKLSTSSVADLWVADRLAELLEIGYVATSTPSALDMLMICADLDKKAAAKLRMIEIRETDPRPTSALRGRIEKIVNQAGARRWNGKIYGRTGCFNFYVNDARHLATDDEVAAHESATEAGKLWDAKYKNEVEAAKD